MKDLDALALEYREAFLRNIVDPIDEAAAACESPIERAMLWALVREADEAAAHDPYNTLQFYKLPGVSDDTRLARFVSLEWYGGFYEFEVFPQLPVTAADRRYRLDFAVRVRRPNTEWEPGSSRPRQLVAFYAVECDGHDFHDRTKEQAERDRVRDRDLQAAGWSVARFTGAEIYRDPIAAAKRVFSFGEQLLDLAMDRK